MRRLTPLALLLQEQIGLDITQHEETVSTGGVRLALERSHGEFVGGREKT